MTSSAVDIVPCATSVECTDDELHVTLTDGRKLSVPLVWFPRLLAATPAQRGDWRLIGGGEGMGPLIPVVRAIARRKPDAHLVVIAGRNQALYHALRAQDVPGPLRVAGNARFEEGIHFVAPVGDLLMGIYTNSP